MSSPAIPPLWTVADLQTISTAIASGVLKVHFQDRTVEYRSVKDLLAARTAIYLYLYPTAVNRQQRAYTVQGFSTP